MSQNSASIDEAKRDTLPALLDRLERATGADREIDFDLYRALNPPRTVQPYGWMIEDYVIAPAGIVHIRSKTKKVLCADFVPEWTKSLDAALALSERVLPKVGWLCGVSGEQFMAELFRSRFISGVIPRLSYATAPTPALALLCATLKALIAQESAR